MYLEKTPCPSGVTKIDAEAVGKYVDDFMMTLLNHPSTKAALGSILKRMLLDLGRHQSTTKRVLSEAISVTTQISHLVHVMMQLMLEQMRIIQCRKLLSQQLMTQFCKITKFGRLVQQVEMLIQQFHSAFYHGVGGISFRGLPRLTIDTSDVVYHCGGAFHKWQRKENGNSGRYAAARARVKDLDVEVSGTVIILSMIASNMRKM